MKNKTAVFVCLFVLIAAVIAVYASSLKGVFLYDDETQIVSNPYIKSFKNIPVIFATGFNRLDKTGGNYYRPLLEVSYVPDHFLWGKDPRGYHITNILFHLGSVIALFLLVRRFFGDTALAFFTALFLGVHPLYTSAVTYIAGRADTMVICFALLSLYFIERYMEVSPRPRYYFLGLSAGFYFLALLTKEFALLLTIVVFGCTAYAFFVRATPDNRHRWISLSLCLGMCAFVYVVMRAYALQDIMTTQFNIAAQAGYGVCVLTALKSLLVYLRILAMPYDLHFERTIPLATSFSLPIAASLVIMVLGAVYVWKKRRLKDPVSFGLAWFMITFFPVSNIIIPLNAFIAENWIQIPALGIFLAASAMLLKVGRRSLSALLIILIVYYGWGTIQRNREYYDAVTFYTSAIRYEPRGVKLFNNLGVVYEGRNDMARAQEMYDKAYAIDPNHVQTINNLANVYSSRGDYARAITLYEKALAINPDDIVFLNNLGVAYIRQGDRQNALKCWEKSLALRQDQPAIRQYVNWNQ